MPRLTCLLVIVGLATCAPAMASEGGLGRPITGMQAASYSGLIPPKPGLNLALGYVYYDGTISASREVPIAGGSTLGLEGTFQLMTATGLYVWNTKPGAWNFATAAVLPYAWVKANVRARVGTVSGELSDNNNGLFDITFAPVIASRHFSKTSHMSFALYIATPSGSYTKGRLANLSLNNWTYSPTVGYTQLFQEGSLEWSTTAALDFYTKDDATDYTNGTTFRVDSLMLKRFPSGLGLGVVGGWIQQLEDDTGPVADRLGGFQGHSLGIGPVVTYASTGEGSHVELSARWVHEFHVKNRLKGNPIMLTGTISF